MYNLYKMDNINNLKYCSNYYYVKNNLYFTHIAKTGGTFLLRNFIKEFCKFPCSIYKNNFFAIFKNT